MRSALQIYATNEIANGNATAPYPPYTSVNAGNIFEDNDIPDNAWDLYSGDKDTVYDSSATKGVTSNTNAGGWAYNESAGSIWANTVKEFSDLADKLGPSPLRPRRS